MKIINQAVISLCDFCNGNEHDKSDGTHTLMLYYTTNIIYY